MPLRLSCVIAHPDDECFAFGGALTLAARQGIETSVLCLTDGQAATHRGNAESAEALGRMRREEFAASCAILGVTHHDLLDYQDAQLEHEPLSKLAARVVPRIRSFRPHVVITFGGEGALNSHPDHTTVSAATTAAFHWAGNPKRLPAAGEPWRPQRLFYLSGNFFLPERYQPSLAPWTHTLDIRSVLATKMEAFKAHTSQAPLMEQTRTLFAEHGSEERYALAASINPQPAPQADDLFGGLTGD
jgi:LmbE family N-acetylglucosaminyl deacetylase